MDASKVIRQLKDLDTLEKRIKQTVNPSKILLQQIAAKRNELLGSEEKK